MLNVWDVVVFLYGQKEQYAAGELFVLHRYRKQLHYLCIIDDLWNVLNIFSYFQQLWFWQVNTSFKLGPPTKPTWKMSLAPRLSGIWTTPTPCCASVWTAKNMAAVAAVAVVAAAVATLLAVSSWTRPRLRLHWLPDIRPSTSRCRPTKTFGRCNCWCTKKVCRTGHGPDTCIFYRTDPRFPDNNKYDFLTTIFFSWKHLSYLSRQHLYHICPNNVRM